MTRRKMCFRGCDCQPCSEQREIDRAYSRARFGVDEYKSRQALYRRANRYGLTPRKLALMEERQNYLCAVCGKPETTMGPNGKVRSLAVDHNHETGEVRALLCCNCNRAIGLFGDDPEIMRSAIAYLERY